MNGQNQAVFDIGLVQAGAISAGAYTAGVIDFLIEALDAWEDAKARGDKDVPHHRVRLKLISGASAGGMTAALSAVAFYSEIEPVHLNEPAPAPARNRLYDAWVRQVDISRLLGTADLEGDQPVTSLLNAVDLLAIAHDGLRTKRRATTRPYVADPLVLLMTVANLRGVPYGFGLYQSGDYKMRNHMDEMRYSISPNGRGCVPGTLCLDPGALFANPDTLPAAWEAFVTAALASGAIPLVLATRHLSRQATDYDPCPCELIGCAPTWGGPPPNPYRFLAVDGGLMNNEPLQLARAYLAGSVETHNERCGMMADRAVVLIDPFPNEEACETTYAEDDRLFSVAAQMFDALKNQARFHALDMELIADPNVFSRFAISPIRRDSAGKPMTPAMCAEYLGGFGGFLKEAFREHDFHLGRQNCQAFLRHHFSLPEQNPLFANDSGSASRERYYVRDENGAVVWTTIAQPRRDGYAGDCEAHAEAAHAEGQPTRMLPIIPLMAPLNQPLPMPPWPDGLTPVEWKTIEEQIATRIRKVGTRLIETELSARHPKGANASLWERALRTGETAAAQALWLLLRGWLAGRVTKAVAGKVPQVH